MCANLNYVFAGFAKLARVSLLVVFGGMICAQTHANVTDSVRFKVEGMVIVWGGKSNNIAARPPQAVAGQSTEITVPSFPVTGNLIPVAGPNITPLVPLSGAANGATRFFVASNTAFSIDAELDKAHGLSLDRLQDIRFDLKVTLDGDGPIAFGRNAQFPHSSGEQGGMRQNTTLADLAQRTTVFRGDRATAASPGTITDQSVEFEVTYTHTNQDIPTQVPAVILTVFIP